MSNIEYGMYEEAAKALEVRNAKILEALATVLASNIPSCGIL